MSRRYALVTGAASGLGRATALRLARDGWHVALADLDLAGAEATLAQVKAAGGSGQAEPLDVREPADWQALRTRLEADWPRLDLLVNNAGVCAGGLVGDLPLDDWHWVLDTNLYGVIYGCHTMVDWLKANPRGSHLVNVASAAAFICGPAMPAYNVAKAGVVALSETLHTELAPHRVGVSVVCPGFIPTPILERGRFADPAVRAAAESYMQRAQLTADQVADLLVHAVGTRELYLVLGRRARFFWRFKRFFPRLFHRVIGSGYRRALPKEAVGYKLRATSYRL